jgi:beta-galactosidase
MSVFKLRCQAGIGLLAFILIFISVGVFAQGRQLVGFNDQWFFSKDVSGTAGIKGLGSLQWEPVTLPHTWNDKDVNDDEPGYYRGTGWYKKDFVTEDNFVGKAVFLSFDGVNQETEIYINGKLAGKHLGGYTRFIIPVTQILNFKGSKLNQVAVKVTNRFNDDIPPLTADFTFFGGIYRNVNLLIANPVHFSQSDFGSTGVFISTPRVAEQSKQIQVKSVIENTSSVPTGNVKLVTTVFDAEGLQLASHSTETKIACGEKKAVMQDLKLARKPSLWSPAAPYLYRVVTQIINKQNKEVLDEVSNPLGFRWFKFDADKGFYLNGQPFKIIGASRHQDYKGLGNAVPPSMQIHDMELLKAMGGNFVRIAHYPQDPVILQTCDKLGILASVEIPVVDGITETGAFAANCKNMQIEMVRQNFNHPAVILWGYMNEVLLKPKYVNDKPRQTAYYSSVRNLAKTLDSLTRKEDASRYTMIACHGDFDLYHNAGITQVPMVLGWNLYQGWYSADLVDFSRFLDRHHQVLPTLPLLVTEYGADTDPRIHAFKPLKFDKSIEYALKYHQVYLNAIIKRPFVSGAMAWNLADFSSETREETMPHINNKGLLTIDRRPKDSYYLYQAYLLNKPFVKILPGLWKYRSGKSDSATQTCNQPIQVISNTKNVELFLNGKSLGAKPVIDHISEWMVPFADGANQIKAVSLDDSSVTDVSNVNFKLLPFAYSGNQPVELNILLGSQRYFMDETMQQLWMPDQPYKKGSWGFVGGEAFINKGSRLSYGTGKNILKTDNDPVYQTQQVGLNQYKLDVPDGEYELTLHFAELIGGAVKESLVYNLDKSVHKEQQEQRIFDVKVNGSMFLPAFNIATDYGYATAVSKKINVIVSGHDGLTIDFTPIKGKPVLNALQLRRIY